MVESPWGRSTCVEHMRHLESTRNTTYSIDGRRGVASIAERAKLEADLKSAAKEPKKNVDRRCITKKDYEAHGARAISGALRRASDVLGFFAVGPAKALFRPAEDGLAKAAKAEGKIAEILEMFMPFVAESEWIFSCENTRRVMARMPPDERARFCWSPEAIDWRSAAASPTSTRWWTS